MDTAAAIIENLNTVVVNGKAFTYGSYAEAVAQRNTWVEQCFERATETSKLTVEWGGFEWIFRTFASGASDTFCTDTRRPGILGNRCMTRTEVAELIGKA